MKLKTLVEKLKLGKCKIIKRKSWSNKGVKIEYYYYNKCNKIIKSDRLVVIDLETEEPIIYDIQTSEYDTADWVIHK